MSPSSPGRRKRVTAKDVAERANVAISTVSKALSGRGSVRYETRQRILQAADELGFQPNQLAASLLTGRTRTIGVITSDHFGRFTLPALLGIFEELAELDYALVLYHGRGDPIRERHFAESLIRRRVDGIIVAGAGIYGRPPLAPELSIPVPVAYALAWTSAPDSISVIPDHVDGGRIAVKHLLSTGRSRICFIGGTLPRHSQSVRDDAATVRLQGVTDELNSAGLTLVHEPLIGEWSEQWGRHATRQLVQSGADPDAIICASDQIARGVLDELRELERPVPSSIAVLGFDNWDAVVHATRPTLTSVDLALTEVGQLAAREVVSAIDNGGWEPGIRRVPVRLIARDSTASR